MKTHLEILDEQARLLQQANALNGTVSNLRGAELAEAALQVKLLIAKAQAIGWVLESAPRPTDATSFLAVQGY